MQSTTTTADRYLKAEEVANRLNCAKSTIYRLAQTGRIPAISIGRTGVRFDMNAVLEALRKSR
jgi:excisionase family DNA binding protein